MAAKNPVLEGNTTTASVMGWGFNPYISEQSPYHGAIYAVIESVAKVVAAGGSYHKCWASFKEFFERTQNNPSRWGKPFAALLGALKASLGLGIAAIGGKDSMSSTLKNIDVPPSRFLCCIGCRFFQNSIPGNSSRSAIEWHLSCQKYDENKLPCFESVKAVFDKMEKLIADGTAKSVWTLTYGRWQKDLPK